MRRRTVPRPSPRKRWALPQRSMRAVPVVVLDVGEQHALKMTAAEDQQPVDALSPHASDPALRLRVRLGCTRGRPNDPDPLRAKDLVKGGAELGVPVADQKAKRAARLIGARHYQVARLLGDPGAVAIRRHARGSWRRGLEERRAERVDAGGRIPGRSPTVAQPNPSSGAGRRLEFTAPPAAPRDDLGERGRSSRLGNESLDRVLGGWGRPA